MHLDSTAKINPCKIVVHARTCFQEHHRTGPLIGGRTLQEWGARWVDVDCRCRAPHLRHQVGLLRFLRDKEIVYVGQAIGLPGGLCNRVADFNRTNEGGRNHYAGKLIHANIDHLRLQVIITGSDHQAALIAQQLKPAMLKVHNPLWNARQPRFSRKG